MIEVSYAVRYYFFGVPRNKHYGYRSFKTLDNAIDFCNHLDEKDIECFDIAKIEVIHKQCLSDKYCPATTQCRKCKYKREDYDYDS